MKTTICILLLALVASNYAQLIPTQEQIKKQLSLLPTKEAIIKQLIVTGKDMSVCMVKKKIESTITDPIGAMKNFFGVRRRLQIKDIAANIAIALAKKYAKKALVKACLEAGVAIIGTKLKPMMSEYNWKIAGNPCAREIVQRKCQAKVQEVVGRRLVATQADSKTWVDKFVSESSVKKFRNYAVTDFTNYMNDRTIAGHISDADLQHQWALYKKWHTRSDGAYGGVYPKEIKFQYVAGKDRKTAPTIDVAAGTAGAKEVKMVGWGQCDYFGLMAYNNLKKPAVGKMAGKAPIVSKISTPGHNWVIVNQDAPKANWMLVDLWLYAMGVPYNKSICPYSSGIGFQDMKVTPITGFTYNPNA